MPTYQKKFHWVAVLAVVSLIAAYGCQRQEVQEIPFDQQTVENVPMPQVPTTVMIPDEIAGKWKGVVLEVADKDSGKSTDITADIGETTPLGDTGLTVYVEAFLPHFTMAGEVFTSSSAELVNPAARTKITDAQGNELFYGWLFSLYPDTHPLEHPTYRVILKDYVAAK
jgi:hypothetical protein